MISIFKEMNMMELEIELSGRLIKVPVTEKDTIRLCMSPVSGYGTQQISILEFLNLMAKRNPELFDYCKKHYEPLIV
jgi:hypothetical protein